MHFGLDLKYTKHESRSDARQIKYHATFLCTHTNGSALRCAQKVLQTKPPQSMRPQRNAKVLKVSVKRRPDVGEEAKQKHFGEKYTNL